LEVVVAGHSGRWWFPVAFSGLLLLAAGPSRGEEARLAISGYDPVAYFTDGKPVPGQSELEHRWRNARWRFASPAHRDLFASDPGRYAPQYDGFPNGPLGVKPPSDDLATVIVLPSVVDTRVATSCNQIGAGEPI
jgi:hypothetical protein